MQQNSTDDILERVLIECCGEPVASSCGLYEYAEAIRYMASIGRLTIDYDDHDRLVQGTWLT